MNPDQPQPALAPQQPTPLPHPTQFGTGSLPSLQPSPQPQSSTQPSQPLTQPVAAIAPAPQQSSLDNPFNDSPTGQDTKQFSVDYLNQIAPQEQRTVHRFAVFGLIGGVLFALAIAFFLIINSGGPNFTDQAKSIQARIGTLQTVTDAQQDHLKDSKLVEANATLTTTLKSMDTDLGALMKARGLKLSDNQIKALKKSENGYQTTLSKKLDDAYMRGSLDRTYVTQMNYELTLLRGKLTKLKATSNSKSIDEFCVTGVKNIDVILASYNSYYEATT